MKLFQIFENTQKSVSLTENNVLDTVGRKLKVSTTKAAPKAGDAPKWATHVGQTPSGAYHWLSNETPVETDDSDNYFPMASKTEFTGFMGKPNKFGAVEKIEMLGETNDSQQGGVTYEEIVNAWKQEFPNSSVGVGKAFGGGYTFKFRLAKDKTEVASGIMDNDPLNYSALLDENGNWKEWSTSMSVAPPEDSYLVYGSVKFRKKSAKNVTLPQIQKRFKQVKEFVAANADKLKDVKFDINQKLGKSVTEAGRDGPIRTTKAKHKNKKALRKRQGVNDIADLEENDQDKTWNTLKGENGYDVYVRWNFWSGKYYEDGIRPIRVLASTPEEAKQFVISNLDTVEDYFRKMRIRRGAKSVPAVRNTETLRLTPKSIGKVTPTGLHRGKIMNQQGELVNFNRDELEKLRAVDEQANAVMNETSEQKQEVLIRLQNAGGEVYDKAKLVNGDKEAILARNGNVRFAIFPDGTYKRAKQFIDFQRDGWELEMNLGEAIVQDGDDVIDDETGYVYKPNEVEKDANGNYREKRYQATAQDNAALQNWKSPRLDDEEPSTLNPGQKAQAQGMFGDVAAAGGDPVDYLMMELGMSMAEINSLARENGYTDATEWAESYRPQESIGEARTREAKQNWFETLNAALESEGLLSTWDSTTMGGISYGENRSWNAVDDQGQCRHISIYRETDGRYERPVHYPSKACQE